ncbi:unnamed protein product [Soboliphyme baturini]|uniref:BAH domain-containing protein n=1 Tax=Soboliphyme baturini TaxID=241478 RepID=A0A183IQC9_9BILA|nr:unnamed protein product [Soboliphyme baturini]
MIYVPRLDTSVLKNVEFEFWLVFEADEYDINVYLQNMSLAHPVVVKDVALMHDYILEDGDEFRIRDRVFRFEYPPRSSHKRTSINGSSSPETNGATSPEPSAPFSIGLREEEHEPGVKIFHFLKKPPIPEKTFEELHTAKTTNDCCSDRSSSFTSSPDSSSISQQIAMYVRSVNLPTTAKFQFQGGSSPKTEELEAVNYKKKFIIRSPTKSLKTVEGLQHRPVSKILSLLPASKPAPPCRNIHRFELTALNRLSNFRCSNLDAGTASTLKTTLNYCRCSLEEYNHLMEYECVVELSHVDDLLQQMSRHSRLSARQQNSKQKRTKPRRRGKH